jgi:hypothetical protein
VPEEGEAAELPLELLGCHGFTRSIDARALEAVVSDPESPADITNLRKPYCVKRWIPASVWALGPREGMVKSAHHPQYPVIILAADP